MQKIWILFGLIGMLIGMTGYAYSQETNLATFQETAQIIIDKSISQNVTASIALQSTSIQEIKIPAELEQKIREDRRITAIVVTNENHCILGVFDESCIIINVARNPEDKGILAIQNTTKRVASLFIDDVNQALDTEAKFHSVFIQSGDEISKALETSGSISGKGTVSAVYTMPMEDTASMYEKISALLLPREIRDRGGFYEVAKNLSKEENAKMTFSIIPIENKSLLQLKLSVDYPNTASSIKQINPLELLKTNELKRSEYFSSGFYPLNSILQVVVLSPESTNVSDVRGNIIPTQLVDGEKIPTEITKEGWIFDPEQGKRIQGKFIFGERKSIDKNELIFSLGGSQLSTPKIETSFDESVVIVIIISVVAIGAAIYYLKGYRK
ncbi:MAG: hypothetical protein RI100_05670 [Nitrosarchaeum sp.]|jgi:hypothetical protein|uniref:hypothetical protein n=1 Tax=Nitrosarchaeum sp. TaxID=2026886 RepID=UPI002DF39475|nr:hypothetical protein [Nitrosarchaeum sp.]